MRVSLSNDMLCYSVIRLVDTRGCSDLVAIPVAESVCAYMIKTGEPKNWASLLVERKIFEFLIAEKR